MAILKLDSDSTSLLYREPPTGEGVLFSIAYSYIFVLENISILLQISIKQIPTCPTDN